MRCEKKKGIQRQSPHSIGTYPVSLICILPYTQNLRKKLFQLNFEFGTMLTCVPSSSPAAAQRTSTHAHHKWISSCLANLKNSTLKGRLDGPAQHEGLREMLLKEHPSREVAGGILAYEMGLGKTNLSTAVLLANPLPRTLVLTPVGTLGHWKRTLTEFGGIQPYVLRANFQGVLPEAATVVLAPLSIFHVRARKEPSKKGPTGGGLLCSSSAPPSFLKAVDWDRVVLDEGQVIRNTHTQLHQKLSKLCARIRWILSGTPVNNKLKDLVSLASWIGVPRSDASAKSLDDHLDVIHRDFWIRRTMEEEGERNPRCKLPPLKQELVRLTPSPPELELYDLVEDRCMKKIAGSSTLSVQRAQAMLALLRLRQLCILPEVFLDIALENDYPPSLTSEIPNTKVDYILEDVIKHAGKHQSLICCSFLEEMHYLERQLHACGISCEHIDGSMSSEDRETVISNFNRPDGGGTRVLLLQILCAVGLNLQSATRVYITTPQYNPCIELQAIGRAHRKGQTQVVTCIRLMMAGTVEERCLAISQRKMDMIAHAMKDDKFKVRLIDPQAMHHLTSQELQQLFPAAKP